MLETCNFTIFVFPTIDVNGYMFIFFCVQDNNNSININKTKTGLEQVKD